MKNITTIGVDFAKKVIQVHGIDKRGRTVLRRKLTRQGFVAFSANLPVYLVGMEACASAHYLARQLEKLGYRGKLMALALSRQQF